MQGLPLLHGAEFVPVPFLCRWTVNNRNGGKKIFTVMPRKNHVRKRINQLAKKWREALAKVNRLTRENEELIARAEEAERQLAKLEVLK